MYSEIDNYAKIGNYDKVKSLLQIGIKCTKKALDEAAKNGYFEIVKLLHLVQKMQLIGLHVVDILK